MTFDFQTVAGLAALIASIVGVTKFLIPESPSQNDYVRLLSAIVGSIVFCLAEIALPGFHLSGASAAHVLLPALAQGFTTGAGATIAVKAYHIAQDRMAIPSAVLIGGTPIHSFATLEAPPEVAPLSVAAPAPLDQPPRG